jgi:methylglutaconyl-CoA hydratase
MRGIAVDLRTIKVVDDGPVMRVEFCRHGPDNVVDEALLDDLDTVLIHAYSCPDLRVLVVSSAGADFSLGADRREFADLIRADPSGGSLRRLADKARRVCEALGSIEAVTIARIQGRAIGAGLALAVFCDLRAATEDSKFRLPEAALGLPAAWGGALARLSSEAGAARIREFAFIGENIDAHTARELSILHRVVPTPEDLDAVIETWAARIRRRPFGGIRATKRLLLGYEAVARMGDMARFDSDFLSSAVAAQHADRRWSG